MRKRIILSFLLRFFSLHKKAGSGSGFFDPAPGQYRISAANISAGGVDSYIITVRSPEEAVKKARELADEGFGALEVCGAFGENLAREMYQAADRRLTVSYVVCPKDQEEASLQFWGPGKA